MSETTTQPEISQDDALLLLSLLKSAVGQIEYLHSKFMPTASGISVIDAARAAIAAAEAR